MKIGFTKKQFRQLVQLAFIGDWIINGYRTEDFIEESQDLLDYLISNCSKMGLDDIIDYDKKSKRNISSEEFKEDCLNYIDQYSSNDFWEHLCVSLAERDLKKEYSVEEIKNFEKDEFLDKLYKIVSFYSGDFRKNGLDNIILEKK